MAGYGDHQVANVAAEVEARTIGAKVLRPDMLRPWRTWEVDPWPGLGSVGEFPAKDVSVFTVWDGGSRPFPLNNVAQDDSKKDDPHEWVRRTRAARDMKAAFLDWDSRVVDTCGGYCDTDAGYRSPDYATDIQLDPLQAAGVTGDRHP
jgi:hypothetical protein